MKVSTVLLFCVFLSVVMAFLAFFDSVHDYRQDQAIAAATAAGIKANRDLDAYKKAVNERLVSHGEPAIVVASEP